MKLEMTCVPIILILIARTRVRTLSLINHYPQDYTIHRLLWEYCTFISGECNELIAIYNLVIVAITVV